MKRLTRQELWDAVCKKYPTLKAFSINVDYGYVCRPHILKLLHDFNIHKSRHLTKEQKERLKYEEKLKIYNKL